MSTRLYKESVSKSNALEKKIDKINDELDDLYREQDVLWASLTEEEQNSLINQ